MGRVVGWTAAPSCRWGPQSRAGHRTPSARQPALATGAAMIAAGRRHAECCPSTSWARPLGSEPRTPRRVGGLAVSHVRGRRRSGVSSAVCVRPTQVLVAGRQPSDRSAGRRTSKRRMGAALRNLYSTERGGVVHRCRLRPSITPPQGRPRCPSRPGGTAQAHRGGQGQIRGGCRRRAASWVCPRPEMRDPGPKTRPSDGAQVTRGAGRLGS